MQIQLFTIPAIDGKGALEEMNRFLRGHRVLEVRQEFAKDIGGAFWYFSIKYIDGMFSSPNTSKNVKKQKVDYKEVLDKKDFAKFDKLRKCRKEIAQKDAVPAYAIFTDAELAEIAKMPEMLVEKLENVKGIGKKKAEKYGGRIIDMFRMNLIK